LALPVTDTIVEDETQPMFTRVYGCLLKAQGVDPVSRDPPAAVCKEGVPKGIAVPGR
jgi:hypothetical protein